MNKHWNLRSLKNVQEKKSSFEANLHNPNKRNNRCFYRSIHTFQSIVSTSVDGKLGDSRSRGGTHGRTDGQIDRQTDRHTHVLAILPTQSSGQRVRPSKVQNYLWNKFHSPRARLDVSAAKERLHPV